MADIRPTFDDLCPWVPDGATEWEAQEISRHWRNALSHLDGVRVSVGALADRLWLRGRWRVPSGSMRYDHRLQGGGVTSDAMQAEAEMVALARVLDGVEHRLAVMEMEKS